MTPADAKALLALFSDTPDSLRRPCRHGHAECSTEYKGECLDEIIQAACNLPEETPADPQA